MKSLDHNDIEEVFFNYYEGNLSEDEKTELFSFLDKNPALYQDFTLWKDSYVHEPLPAIDALENRLIRKEEPSYRMEKSLAYKLIALGGAGAILWWNISDRNHNYKSNDVMESTKKTEAPAALNLSQKRNKINLKKSTSRATGKNQVESVKEVMRSQMVSINDTISSNEKRVEELKTDIVAISSFDSIGIDTTALSNHEQNGANNSTPQSIQLSKKELKKIEKAKERSKIRRQEQEFLKGDQPYVVPIDPSRF